MSRSDITKRALADAFLAELDATSFDRVTVTAVTRRCGLSRQSFYYHFYDLYALVAWIYEQEAMKALGDMRTYDTWEQGLLAVLERLVERREFVMRTIRAVDLSLVVGFLRERVGTLLRDVVDETAGGLAVSEDDRELVASFYAAGIIDAVWRWVDGGMVGSPEREVARLALVVRGDVPAALRRLAQVSRASS